MFLMDILKAFLYGILEGITEWLPVSSTGHLLLLGDRLKFSTVSDSFFSVFEVVIQLGAILAVLSLLYPHIKDMLLWIKLAISCIPAGLVGVLLDDLIEELFYRPEVVAVMLILVGVIFLLLDRKARTGNIDSIEKIDCKTAFILGLFQAVAAIFPGTSRSGATFIGGMLCNLERKTIAEFSFFMAFPVMLGASGWKLYRVQTALSSFEIILILVGGITAYIVSCIGMKFLLNYVKTHHLSVFAWYRIALGILVLLIHH